MYFRHIHDVSNPILNMIQWGFIQRGSYNYYFILLFDTTNDNDDVVGYAIISTNPNKTGINLQERYFSKINNVIDWLEIKPKYRNKGYGSVLIEHIKDLYSNYYNDAIALYAKISSGDTAPFYFKRGAIILHEEGYEGTYMVFLPPSKNLNEYYPEDEAGSESYDKAHSLRRICKVIRRSEDDDGEYVCNWFLADTDTKCEGCEYNRY